MMAVSGLTGLITTMVTFVLAIPLAIIIGIVVLLGLLIVRGGARRGAVSEAEETKIIQDIHLGLRKMEERIETLETILIEKERKGK